MTSCIVLLCIVAYFMIGGFLSGLLSDIFGEFEQSIMFLLWPVMICVPIVTLPRLLGLWVKDKINNKKRRKNVRW